MLIATYDSALRDDSVVNYAAFAKRIKFPHESDSERDDRVFRQQMYAERIREHAQQLTMRTSPQKSTGSSTGKNKLPSLQTHVYATFVSVAEAEDGCLRNHDESARGMREMLTGSNNAFTALPAIPKPHKRATNANEELLLLSSSAPRIGCEKEGGE